VQVDLRDGPEIHGGDSTSRRDQAPAETSLA
jgi:hypothetical protein